MTIGTVKGSAYYEQRLTSNKTASVPPPARTQKSITVFGNLQVSTAQYKYGTASALADGTGDYLKITNFETSADAMEQDFTIEGWLRFNILPNNQTGGGGNYMTLYFCETALGLSVEPYVLIDNDASNHPQVAVGFTYGGVASYATWTLSTTTITTGVWYHVALVRYSGTWKSYWNGVDMGTAGVLTNWPPNVLAHPIEQRSNWAGWPQTGRGYWNGNIDDLRVSCIARYKTAFTPPAAQLVNDEATLLLLHFEGTDGSQVITDDIGA